MIGSILPGISRRITGIVHVGAADGSEAETYDKHGIYRVAWVDDNEDEESFLRERCQRYGHVHVKGIVADGKTHTMYVTDDKGHSSSIFPRHIHQAIWGNLHTVGVKSIETVTLDDAVSRLPFSPNFLVMDIQGAELLALQNAPLSLPKFRWAFIEVCMCELYQNCSNWFPLSSLMSRHGFRPTVAFDHGVGTADVLFEKIT